MPGNDGDDDGYEVNDGESMVAMAIKVEEGVKQEGGRARRDSPGLGEWKVRIAAGSIDIRGCNL